MKDHIDTKIEYSINEVENTPIFNELKFSISESEVTKAMKSLKNGKYCGLSLILNEIFSLVFTNGIYPMS